VQVHNLRKVVRQQIKDAMGPVVKSARHTHAVVASNPAGDSLWTLLEHRCYFLLVFSLVERRRVGDGHLRQCRPRAAARFSNDTLSSFNARHARSSPALGDSLRQEASWVECLSHSAPKSCQDDPHDDLKPTG